MTILSKLKNIVLDVHYELYYFWGFQLNEISVFWGLSCLKIFNIYLGISICPAKEKKKKEKEGKKREKGKKKKRIGFENWVSA